jgi:hypothetical protein
MGAISFTGAFNANTLTVPGVYINAQPPGAGVIRPATFGLLGIEGVASWGPVDVATLVPSTASLGQFGSPVVRPYDLVTACSVALQIQQAAGIGANLIVNRVTDGTDTAATGTLGGGTGLTLTSKYTGTLANAATATIAVGTGSTSAVAAYKITLQMPNMPAEVFDNITGGIFANTVSAGTGATAVPTLTFSAPTGTGGIQAVGSAALTVVGTPTIGSGGTGNSVGDFITFSNGVVLKVATVSGSAVATFSPVTTTGCSGGSLTGAGTAVPTNPVAMVSTTGGGSAVTANLTWGLGPVTMQNNGSGYPASGATCTVSSTGGSGTVTPVVSYWGQLSNAINNGNSALRGPSQLMVASYGNSSSAPATSGGSATVTLNGGTDGTAGITSAKLVGNDAYPRTGIYTFRSSGCSDMFIADFSDTTQEGSLYLFGASEGIYVHTNGPSGETTATAATTESSNGSTGVGPWLKRYLGDWCAWNDNTNGVQRSLGPATFGAAILSTLQPQQAGLNKAIPNIVSTTRSRTGIPYGADELAQAKAAGVEVIANPIPAGPGFGMNLGISLSANGAANTDNWPRLTSFLARSIVGPGALGTLIGQTITAEFFTTGYDMLDAFLSPMAAPGPNQIIQGYSIAFSTQNNPQSQTAQGIVVAQVWVQYLGIAQVFLVNMQSGAAVVLPANSNVAAAAAQLAAA